MADQGTSQRPLIGELKSQVSKALAAGVVGGLVAASAAAWGVVKNWPGLLGLVPTGAVMAFPTPCASNSGWADYKPATGRVIVGAGAAYSEDKKYYSWKQVQTDGASIDMRLTPYGVLDAGGEELHVLNIREMPAHNHNISTRKQSNIHDALAGSQADYGIDFRFDPSASTDGGYGPLHEMIGPSGGGVGHNTMPPYIALYWCQKT